MKKFDGNNFLLSAVILSGMILTFPTPKSYADTLQADDYNSLKSAITGAVVGELRTVELNNDITGLSTKIDILNGQNVTIDGKTGYSLISSGTHLGFDNKGTLSVVNTTLKNFNSTGWGGAIYNEINKDSEGILNIQNVSFSDNTNNHSGVGGGAVGNYNGTVYISGNTSFTGNKNTNAYGKGGAIYNGNTTNSDNTASIFFSTSDSETVRFTSNNANYKGGAIYNESNIVFDGGNYEFINNATSLDTGGAIYNNGNISLNGGFIFDGNQSNTAGGAVANYNTMNFINTGSKVTEFKNNIGKTGGGAIYNRGTIDFIGNYIFSNNSNSVSYRNGGAILNDAGGELTFEGAYKFEGNSSTLWGGAVYNASGISFGNSGDDLTEFLNNTSGNSGGAIYNDSSATLSLFGNYKFDGNSSANNSGGAIYNKGILSLEGDYVFSNNSSNDKGGALFNESGVTNIIGRELPDGSDSITFIGNTAKTRGGALYVTGVSSKHAYLNIKHASFENNVSGSHGGAIYIDNNVSFNIESSNFIGNIVAKDSDGSGWGGALGLASETDNVYGYVKDSVFKDNYSGNSGAAIPAGTALTVVNSEFMGNRSYCSGPAISYNPKRGLSDKAFKLVANGGNTVFSNNWIGAYDSVRTAENSEGLYLGNAIVGDDGKAITGADGNDSNIYFNAGNSGQIIFNDIVNALGDAKDDTHDKKLDPSSPYYRDDVNNPNIQLNQDGIHYFKFEANSNDTDDTLAPTNGTIVFNNKLKGANLVLHNGTLAFGQKNTYEGYLTPDKYFDDTAKITLKGGTLDLGNDNIESKTTGIFNPESLNVLGSANLRLDVNLTDGVIDYIDSEIKGSGVLTIDKLSFMGDLSLTSFDLGDTKKLQFAKANLLSEGKTKLAKNLETVITSNAGYSLVLSTTNIGKDSVAVTKFVDAGGLPVALSLGQDEELSAARTYIYNATTDEEITASGGDNAWDKGYNVLLDGVSVPRTTSNKLRGSLLQINGNGKNIITSDNIIGIELGVENGKTQNLVINDVKKADGTGWKGFNSAIINHGGVVDINSSIFSNNDSSAILSADSSVLKAGNGGALYNESGIINIVNTEFTGNTATGDGGAIYNSGTVNIIASDANNSIFSKNKADNAFNDIYNSGELNISAISDMSSVIFNGGISGNGSGVINIGYTNNENLGNVIFNDTVANQSVFLNNGTLQLGSNATSARTDYFDNVNLTLNGGKFNLANGYLDTVKVNDFTVGANSSQLLLDVDLSSENSDNILVSNTYTDNGKLLIGPLNILSGLAEGTNTAVITYINKEITADIEDVNRYITVNGVTYAVSVDKNKLYISEEGKSGGFAYEVINTARANRTYTIGSEDENVTKWVTDNNNLAGIRFQVLGGNYGKSIYGNGLDGIIVAQKDGNPQELIISGVKSWQDFNSAIINNNGKLTIKDTSFENNNSTTNGGVIRNNSGVVNIFGGSIFKGNSASDNGGAIYNATGAIVNLTADNSKNIEFINNTASKGNDIFSDGTINISGDAKVIFNGGVAGNGTMNLQGGTTVANALIEQKNLNISNGVTFNVNADNLSISDLLVNNGTLELTGGTNLNAVSGSGNTSILGTVINNADIAQNVQIVSSADLTSSLDNISGSLTNYGI